MARALILFLILFSGLSAKQYAFVGEAGAELFYEPDRLGKKTGRIKAGVFVEIIDAATNSRWVKVKTVHRKKAIEGYTFITRLYRKFALGDEEISCLELEGKLNRFKAGCLGKTCDYGKCGGDDLFFLPGGRIEIPPACDGSRGRFTGRYSLNGTTITFNARSSESIKQCQKTCKTNGGRGCKKLCRNWYRKFFRGRRTRVSLSGQLYLKPKITARSRLKYKGKRQGYFAPSINDQFQCLQNFRVSY